MSGWGSLKLEILRGGGPQAVLEIQVEAWVKKPNHALNKKKTQPGLSLRFVAR